MELNIERLANLLEAALNSKDVELSLKLIYKLKTLGVELDFALESGMPAPISDREKEEILRETEFRQEDRTWVKEQLVSGKGETAAGAFIKAKNIMNWEVAYQALR